MKLIRLLFILFPALYLAQLDRVSLDAAIQFEYQGVEYSNIFITNTNTGQQIITNMLGQFKVNAKPGDILSIRGENVEADEVEVSEYNYKNRRILIYLEPIYIPLSNVEVEGFPITGNLEIDARKIQTKSKLDEQLEKMQMPIGNKRDELKHIETPVLPSITQLNLDALYDLISGDKRRKLALYEFTMLKYKIDKVRAYFLDDYFINTLGIPEEEIESFIFTQFKLTNLEKRVDEGNYLAVMEILSHGSRAYKERLNNRKDK